jgi:hypothetical protein
MGIPEEDKMAAWLRDYGSTSHVAKYNSQMGYLDTAMHVDPTMMLDLANQLETEHKQDYCTHAKKVIDKLEYVHGITQFTELDDALTHQSKLAYTSTDMFREHDFAVTKFVTFVREMAEKYKTADADSSIKLSDVQRELPASAPVAPGTAPAASTTTTTTTTTTAAPNLGASTAPPGTTGETSEEI